MSRYHRFSSLKPQKSPGYNLQQRISFPNFFPPKVKDRDKLKSWNIFKGDEVMIISGKDKKEQGKVIDIDYDNNWVYVAGKKLVKKHLPNPLKMEKSTPYDLRESGIHFSNVALLDPFDGKPCKVYWKNVLDQETGKLRHLRFSRRTNLPLSIPEIPRDKTKQPDITEHDTSKAEVSRVTYFPSLTECPVPPGVRINFTGNY